MPVYTFQTLSDVDFEELCADLLSTELGIRLQLFTKGRDGGIDLLHGDGIHESLIVQCKHYPGSQFKKLLRDLKKETDRITKLRPKRYMVATSCGLTPQNKEEIKLALAPHIKSVQDIYGKNDLNLLLGSHPEIETRHFKLWFTSVAVFKRILRNGEAIWESLEKEEIQHALSIYVRTEAESEALNKLSEHGSCILSGAPGAGKTTLARIIASKYASDGHQVIFVRDDIAQAFDALDPNKKQLIYYDDFLGRTDLIERLGKNEDHEIIRLLKKAKKSANTNVIFTTREYILQDAYRKHERLTEHDVELSKCTVDIAKYTSPQRARLLYNHLYFSEIPKSHISDLIRDKAYLKIIHHENFNPRLIEWMTTPEAGLPKSGEQYAAAFLNALDNPNQIWEKPYDFQISASSRLLLQVLATFSGIVSAKALFDSWINSSEPGTLSLVPAEQEMELKNILKNLDGTFIRIDNFKEHIGIDFHNPSIRDFVRLRLSANADQRRYLMKNSRYFEQVQTLILLNQNGKLYRKPNPDLLSSSECIEAFSRTIAMPNPILSRFNFRSLGHNTVELQPHEVDYGQRLSRIRDWVYSHNPLDTQLNSDALAETLLDSEETRDTISVGALPVLGDWLDDETDRSHLIGKMLNAITDSVSESTTHSDWIQLGTFLYDHKSSSFDIDLDALQSKAKVFWENEIDYALYNANDYSEVDEILDNLDDFDIVWGLSSYEFREQLEERSSELSAGEDAKFDERRDECRINTDPEVDVDILFESLLDRPD